MESRLDGKAIVCVVVAAVVIAAAWKVAKPLGILALILAVAAACAAILKDPFGIYPKK